MNPSAKHSVWKKTGLALFAVLGAVAALVVLYRFAPTEHRFYPQCPLHVLTGWDCPGCGGLRAAHALLHGEVRAAFQFNPLLFLLAPAFAAAGSLTAAKRWTGREWFPARHRPIWIWLLLVAIAAFSVLRNLPLPFAHS